MLGLPIPGAGFFMTIILVTFIGFITKESLASRGMVNEVVVYLPQSYNFAGQIIVVPKEQVTIINASSSEVMAFIVSGGVTGTKQKMSQGKT